MNTLSNTNLVAQRHSERKKTTLPVDARRSKTSLLKLRNITKKRTWTISRYLDQLTLDEKRIFIYYTVGSVRGQDEAKNRVLIAQGTIDDLTYPRGITASYSCKNRRVNFKKGVAVQEMIYPSSDLIQSGV